MTNDTYDYDEERRRGADQARSLRAQAAEGGLRFDAYLPPDLAIWLLDLIEGRVFTDPSEAAFVMLGEQHELAPHADLREELVRRGCQAAIDDPRPGVPHDEVMERLQLKFETPRPSPAVWRRA